MNGSEAVETIRQLFEIWYSPLVRYASRQLACVETAEDVVQEAFLSMFCNLTEGHAVDNPKAWLLCVVRREVIKRYREVQRFGGPFQALPEDFEPAAPQVPPNVDRDELSQLLSALSTREEEVVLLRVKGLKYREIARSLEITVGSVKTMMARAVRKMQTARLPLAQGKEGHTRNDEAVQ